ncbi:PorP/SprF family type IX secretion system membrane protein [Marinifilum flexuosum]|uniref:Type IX secretion system PorP/SprF family membrane protein n=1 Tax=Marinifilum flexuosum TaxID=1117708 RepID=A0A419WWZ6_9BACT|nr:PorP/SprF family type IX secretion system membrane protein [Marinifilum flexuosum]RKD99956.1 type IX secretion system PorP/SprF family membrane protein [Marinifilum flexuosum]
MRKSILILLLSIILGVSKLSAQRVHSSQFYSIPLLLNPALTGNSDYNLRGGINYRNQWNSVTIPFVSQSVFVDGKLSTQLLSSSWIGVGGMIFNDKAGDGGLKTTQVMFASSLNKSLNAGNTLFLHGGVGVEMINKSVDLSKLTFGEQLEGGETGEDFISQSLFYMDFSLGMQVTYFRGKTKYFMGTSVSHINEPKESFYRYESQDINYSTNNLKRRFALHAGAESRISPRMYFKPEIMYTTEKNANEWIAGANFMTLFGNRGTIFHYGLWYRFTQDIIPAFGYERKRLKIMLTYDINVSDLQVASSSRGGLEVSLTYNYNYSNPREIRKLKRRQKVKKLGDKAISCPKFSHED